LPELPDREAKHVQKVYEGKLSAERWLNASTLVLLNRGGWTTKMVAMASVKKRDDKFDARAKLRFKKVRSTLLGAG